MALATNRDLMEAQNRSKAGTCRRILVDLREVLVAIAPSSGQREPWQFQVFGEARSLPRAKTTAVESSASVRVLAFAGCRQLPLCRLSLRAIALSDTRQGTCVRVVLHVSCYLHRRWLNDAQSRGFSVNGTRAFTITLQRRRRVSPAFQPRLTRQGSSRLVLWVPPSRSLSSRLMPRA